jgi:hypothetical protein
MISDQQREFFHTFGFLRFPSLFGSDIEQISGSFEQVFLDNPEAVVEWVHETHENRMRRVIPDATKKSAVLATLLTDARIKGIASDLLGEDYLFRGSDCSIYDCGTLFHRDSYGSDPTCLNLKMALYLDPVNVDSGALRVIPGSHHKGDKFVKALNQRVASGFRDLGLSTDQVPAAIIDSEPGDLILWNYRLIHATNYEGNRRRMLAMEFSGPSE